MVAAEADTGYGHDHFVPRELLHRRHGAGPGPFLAHVRDLLLVPGLSLGLVHPIGVSFPLDQVRGDHGRAQSSRQLFSPLRLPGEKPK